MKKGHIIIGILIVAVLILGYFLLSPGGNTGTLVMQITDAPSDLNITKALVTISNIEVHYAGSANFTNETNGVETGKVSITGQASDDNETTGWFNVVEGPKTFDLIAIKDVKELLGTSELNVGKYTQIRLNVDSALVTIDGTEFNLTTPSDKIKLIHPFDIVAGQETKLTLDFNAQDSITSAGKDKYILKPTISVIEE